MTDSDGQLIYKKMANINAEIGAIGKDSKNKMQGFMYRGIDAIYGALHGLFAKHRVFSTPEVLEERSEERTTKSGGALIYRILRIKYTFYTEDGSSVECTVIGEGMDSGDKASNKAMSVAHKYALLQVFAIPTEEMVDPDSESHEVKPRDTPPKETDTTEADILTELRKSDLPNSMELEKQYLAKPDGAKPAFAEFIKSQIKGVA